jgi:hypothetical protein
MAEKTEESQTLSFLNLQQCFWQSTTRTSAFGFHPSPITITRTAFLPHAYIRICSSPDSDFVEHLPGDEDAEPLLVVQRETFVSEAVMARQANDYIGAAAAASSSSSVVDLPTEIQNSFLQYALSIILDRALPVAREGLKTVHRRILYSMHQLQLTPTMPHRKCASSCEHGGIFCPCADGTKFFSFIPVSGWTWQLWFD